MAISFGIVVLQFFVVVFWSISLRHNINLNAALLLDCGQKIYNGSLPYVDFYEFNPPVIMYLSVIPAWFSSVSGLTLCLSFQIFVSLCIAISGISLFFILKATGFNTEQTLQMISVSMIFHSTTLFFNVFGEREHLMVIGLTPFLIIRCSASSLNIQRNIMPALWFAVGLMAGVMVQIKPHFLIIPIVLETYNLIFRKSGLTYRSQEFIGFSIANLACLAYWFVMPAMVRHNYFGILIPLALGGYDSYSSGFRGFILNFIPYHPSLAAFNITCLSAFILIIFRVFRYRGFEYISNKPDRSFEIGMALAWIGSLLCFISQKKGWFYHMLPMNWFAILGATSIFVSSDFKRLNLPVFDLIKSRFLQISLSTILILFIYTELRPKIRNVFPNPALNLTEFIDSTENGNGRVIIMASSVRAYPALLNAGKTAGSRFMDFFHLPSLYYDRKYYDWDGPVMYRVGATNQMLENRFIDELYSDIQKLQPNLIMINKTNGDMGLPRQFNIRDYYHHHHIAEVLKQDYELADDYSYGIAGELKFEVWKFKKRF
jgi:hypothetical protein